MRTPTLKKLVSLAVLRGKGQGYALRFNRNAAFTLNIHGVENLSGHFTVGQASTNLNKAVSNGRFAVVNMGNN